ncbi:MAG: hypothetical protein ACI97A_001620 [Planctomycetota bacterium]
MSGYLHCFADLFEIRGVFNADIWIPNPSITESWLLSSSSLDHTFACKATSIGSLHAFPVSNLNSQRPQGERPSETPINGLYSLNPEVLEQICLGSPLEGELTRTSTGFNAPDDQFQVIWIV